jgi:hypothetical protein
MKKSKRVICYADLDRTQMGIIAETLLMLGVRARFGPDCAGCSVIVPRTHLWAVWLARRVSIGRLRAAIRYAARGRAERTALKTVVLSGNETAVAQFIDATLVGSL